MPRTPQAERPIERTPDSWKRIALPELAIRTTSFSPSVKPTPINESPDFNSIAIFPLVRCRLNSVNTTFLTIPCCVAIKIKCFSS